MRSSFHAIFWEGIKLILGKHFRKIAQQFFLQHYFWHDLRFALYILEVLCGLGCGCLAFCSPSCSTFSSSLQYFFLCIAHQIGPPPFSSSRGDSLHLWLAFKSCNDPPFFFVPKVGNKLHPIMQFEMLSPPLWNAWGFMFCVNKPMSFCYLHFSPFVGGLTSCY
jgi:hypothetical protein